MRLRLALDLLREKNEKTNEVLAWALVLPLQIK